MPGYPASAFAMRHLSVEPPAFFPRGPSPLARLAFFGVLSLTLLFVDTRYHYLEGLRHAAAVILYPLQRAAQIPGELLESVGHYFVSLRSITADNVELKREVVELALAANTLPAMEAENSRLR